MNAHIGPELILYAVGGLALGICFFGLLLWSVRLQASGAALTRILPLYLSRYVIAGGSFWLIAQAGALPLLTALAGFLIGRYVVQRKGMPS
ncbi:ATP synthase subunit I [Kordiimonas marina]|uniref:ATP synthase subunit I n=1 Tax=Kordiimonas marina TaxID=2872312 RepID=UPI001FF4470F|nr:ATP synthase subunit I [Kordiimonas marina]MCJ9428825.1 ATP synthase subunit I [Kordiimonas marina]